MNSGLLFLNLAGFFAIFVLGHFFFSSSMLRLGGMRMRFEANKQGSLRRVGVRGLLSGAATMSGRTVGATVVAMVNARLTTVARAVAFILGARLGATLLAQLLTLPMTSLAGVVAGGGAFVMIAGFRTQLRYVGLMLFGFGLMFMAFFAMGRSLEGLHSYPPFHALVSEMFAFPVFAYAIGIVTGLVIRRSAPPIALLMLLSGYRLVPAHACVAAVLGINAGTACVLPFASRYANFSARRVAWAIYVVNILLSLVGLALPALGLLPAWLVKGSPAVVVANTHVLFNFVVALVGLPLIPLLIRSAVRMAQEPLPVEPGKPHFLDPNLLVAPPLALELVRRECVRTLATAHAGFKDAVQAVTRRDKALVDQVHEYENRINTIHAYTTSYIVDIARQDLSRRDAAALPVLVRCVDDIEKLGNLAQRITQLADIVIAENLEFRESTLEEIEELTDDVNRMFDSTYAALRDSSYELARRTEAQDEEFAENLATIRQGQLARLRQEGSDPIMVYVFTQLHSVLRDIASFLTDLSLAVINRFEWKVNYPATLSRPEPPAEAGK